MVVVAVVTVVVMQLWSTMEKNDEVARDTDFV